MQLYNMIKNISNKNNEEELKKAITKVKQQLNGLTEERMCKVYCSYLLNELRNNHIPARLINTRDLNLDYEHFFVLVPRNKEGYYLADLTFSQFNEKEEHLIKLLKDGYQYIDNNSFMYYIKIVENAKDLDNYYIDDIYYDIPKTGGKRH